MPADVRALSVFVASPSDVPEEREAVRRAALAINSTIGTEFGLRLDVVGWELVPPGFGRPQELINPMLDNCDIFVGVMYRRWGNPTGTHTSGFEEEYERVLARRQTSETPVIGMYFKKVDDAFLVDPGPDLTKVVAFKKRMQAEKRILYSEFSEAMEFEKGLQVFFLSHITQTLRALRQLSPDSTPTGSVEEPVRPEDELDEARSQLGRTLGTFTDLVLKGRRDGSLDRDRLLLFALSINQDANLIPTHAVNRLYNQSRDIVLAAAEYDTWLRTLAADVARADGGGWERVVPGWRVLFPDPSEDVDWFGEQLAGVAHSDDPKVVSGVLRILTLLRSRPAFLWGNPQTTDAETAGTEVANLDGSSPVQGWKDLIGEAEAPDSVLHYIFAVAAKADMPLLEAVGSRLKDVRAVAAIGLIRRRLAGDTNAIAELAASTYRVPGWLEAPVLECTAELSEENLRKLASRPTFSARRVQLAAVRELVAREKLTPEVVQRALSSSSEEMQKETLEILRAVDISLMPALLAGVDEEKLKEDSKPAFRALTRTAEELRAEIAIPLTGVKAWEALAWKIREGAVHEAREVLDTDALSLAGAFAGLSGVADEKVLEYLKGRARRAAISVLAGLGADGLEPEDVNRVRKEVAGGFWLTRKESLVALAKIGAAEDAETLAKAAFDTYAHDVSEQIARAAIRLGGATFARRLLYEAGDEPMKRGVSRVAAEALCSMPEVRDEEIVALLHHSHESVRILATRGLEERWDRNRLGQLLDTYSHPTAGPYYYNVVVELDQYLYAPTSLRRCL